MSPPRMQAAPFLVFAILAALVSVHAGCVGGALEETPSGADDAPKADDAGNGGGYGDYGDYGDYGYGQ